LATVQNQVEPNLTVTALLRGSVREHFITVTPKPEESSDSLFRRTRDVIRQLGGQVVSMEALGMGAPDREGGERLAREIDEAGVPVAWIESNEARGLCGLHAWVVAGPVVSRLHHEGRVVGTSFEDGSVRYCRLAGLLPTDVSAAQDAQTSEVLHQMVALLRCNRMQFSNVVRTWFYNDSILTWYGRFNTARTHFFNEGHVFDGLLPASTGIAGRNAKAAALTAGATAIEFKSADGAAAVIPSPLQSSATKYGSSFSRAVELTLPDHRRLYISGTASIDETGKTVFLGDTNAQIGKTLEVVGAILSSRGMGWKDISRSIVYVKRAAEAPLFDAYRAAQGLPAFPAVVVESDICREDLLFEIEVDAIKVR
jgi:enamine deaminase RidA (YjgF/YER057c/UK114 family)